jgi:hypothetical protein
MATPTPVDVARVEGVTTEHLGGASSFELAASQTPCLEYILDAQVEEWVAIAVSWDGGIGGRGSPRGAGCRGRSPSAARPRRGNRESASPGDQRADPTGGNQAST